MLNKHLLIFILVLSLILANLNITQAATLAERLRGRILLQVEDNGEAWYVNPIDNKRIYLKDGIVAYNLMSELGLGITNANLAKIPVGIESRFICTDNDADGLCNKLEQSLGTNLNNQDSDGDSFNDGEELKNNYNPLIGNQAKLNLDLGLASSLKGRVLLQVQSQGEAWYINPVDGKRYYMPDGESAYQIMRFLSLGIANQNLNQIPVSNFSITPPVGDIPSIVDTQKPTTPTSLGATANTMQINLSWLAATDNIGISQYQIERSTSSDSGFVFVGATANNFYSNIGLTNDTTYYYRVRAQDTAGNFSNYSNVVSGRISQTVVIDTTAPTAPSNLQAVATSTQITLAWTASTDNVGVVQYHIERSMAATTGFVNLTTVTNNIYINTGLSANTQYYYRVRAADTAGNMSTYSSIVNATTSVIMQADTQVPTTPANLVATASSTQVTLNWVVATDNVGVVQYRVERSTSATTGFDQVATPVGHTYIDGGLSHNLTYYYRVRAFDAAGNLSNYSSVAQVTIEDNYSISQISGEDYTLPASVTASNFSGYVCSNCTNASTTFIWTNWGNIEPQNTNPRTYDWTYIDNQLATAAANGKKVSVMIHSTVAGGLTERSAVPDWVYTEFDLPPYDQLVNMGMTSQIRVIPSWQPEISARFEEMIAAFGARYRNNNTIESIYITAVSHAAGEELYISNPQLTILERDWGLTPAVLQTWLESRMSAWLQALPGEERKLVWVGSATGLSWNNRPDFEAAARYLINFAASNGIGGRAGLVECYLDRVGDYLWSNFKDINGYLYVNEDSIRFDGRYWGDENEEYGPSFTRFGANHSSPVRYRFAIMRTLQARMRFLWTTAYTEAINPSLSNYARLSFGKNVYNSVDAWSFLFQSPQLNTTPIKNFERWLIQRDLPGGMTVPVQRVARAFDAGGAYLTPSLWYDDTARRTDFVSGNNYMFFALDDRFTTSGTVQIKVEMLDNSPTSWHLDYYNSSGSLTSTRNIVNANDGQKKTYTFTLHNPIFTNQLNNMDFRLVNSGPGDLTVSWVRLIRNVD